MHITELTDKRIQAIGYSYHPGFLFTDPKHHQLAHKLKQYQCQGEYPIAHPEFKTKYGQMFKRWYDLAEIYSQCQNHDTFIATSIARLFEETFLVDVLLTYKESAAIQKSPFFVAQELKKTLDKARLQIDLRCMTEKECKAYAYMPDSERVGHRKYSPRFSANPMVKTKNGPTQMFLEEKYAKDEGSMMTQYLDL